MLITTILAPVGIPQTIENHIPRIKQSDEIIADSSIRFLKLFAIFLAITAGNITKLEISNVPIILMPSTTVKAVRKEIKNWYKLTLIPVALANDSSAVIKNRRL
jgi:hypothetical protein